MIQEIVLNGHIIKYQITFKNNKNTYFHFKKVGYIQINASRKQSQNSIKEYMKKNKLTFIKKYERTKFSITPKNSYFLFGKKYQKVSDSKIVNLEFNYFNNTISEPNMSIDQLDILYKKMEKKKILEMLEKLKKKHLQNGLIDIKDITFKTRYMQTRFGSCNPKTKAININLFLVNYDVLYLEYVFLHEISHLIHRNHSTSFYLLLSKLLINHKQLKKELNNIFIYR